MKGAIASVEIYGWSDQMDADSSTTSTGATPRRFTLVVGAPTQAADGVAWCCRVALADWKRPVEIEGIDSVAALGAALAQGQSWLDELREEGFRFTRDRAGELPYSPEASGSPEASEAPGARGASEAQI